MIEEGKKPKDTKKTRDIHQDALEKFGIIYSAVKDEREQCRNDRRFYSIAGAQWEGDLGKAFENKPKMEANKILLAVIRIFNEYRNNRMSTTFISNSPENDDLSDALIGMYRADRQDSCADEAFDNAFEEAVGGGFGAYRLRSTIDDYDDEGRQRIEFEPIFDADTSVFFDLDAKRQDKSDARYCYVIYGMTVSAYEAEFDDSPETWPKGSAANSFDWHKENKVYVAEYYVVEKVREKVYYFQEITGEKVSYRESRLDDEKKEKLLASGARLLKQPEQEFKKIRKYLLSGGKVLKDYGHIAGQCIPIIPVFGKRWYIDGIERCMGHVRPAKDSQRLGNMQRSKLAEISAMSSIEKPIVTPEQIKDHGNFWAKDNIENYAYLQLNPVTDAQGNKQPLGPVGYTRSPQIPPALSALIQITENDINEILGSQGEGDKMVSNISGKAVEMIQTRIDKQSYIYLDNFKKARQRDGEVWLSMAADTYVEDARKMKILDAEGEMNFIELNRPEADKETGEIKLKNDLSRAKHRVVVDVGPSSSSKRESIVRSLTGLLQFVQDPQIASVITSMIMMNMEGEGMGEIRAYFRKKLVSTGVIEPTEQESEEMQQAAQNQAPDPMQGLIAAETAKAESEALKNRVETAETIADTEYTQARTTKILAEASQIGEPNV